MKDDLKNCLCIFSGKEIEISPFTLPLFKFGSFFNAEHRIFMSATISDDAFFIKDFGVDKSVVKEPLTYNKGWSGEKMILIPSLMDEGLTREEVINWIGKAKDTSFGIVVLVPSFSHAKIWEGYGATVIKSSNLVDKIDQFKNGKYSTPLIMASRYDGIDLPDSMCRLLVIDSLPINTTLTDKYYDECVPNSIYCKVKIAQTIEQGLGRAVRSEKDYCAVLLIGQDIIKQIRYRDSRDYFCSQTKRQIEIGLDLARFAKEDKEENQSAIDLLRSVINQCLKRDDSWKNYYIEQMNAISSNQSVTLRIDDIMQFEKKAEEFFTAGKPLEAKKEIQKLLDKYRTSFTNEEIGWHMQTMARYLYSNNQVEAMALQIEAHKLNNALFLPRNGYEVTKIALNAQDRLRNIKMRLSQFEKFEDLLVLISDLHPKNRSTVN